MCVGRGVNMREVYLRGRCGMLINRQGEGVDVFVGTSKPSGVVRSDIHMHTSAYLHTHTHTHTHARTHTHLNKYAHTQKYTHIIPYTTCTVRCLI